MNDTAARRSTSDRMRRAQVALVLTLLVVGGRQAWHLLGIALMGGLAPAEVNWAYYDTISAIGAVLQVSGMIGSGVLFILWERNVARNVAALDLSDLRLSASAVTWDWFIPVVNLVYPYLDMRRIARHSAPPDGRPAFLLVGLWWSAWILAGLLGAIADAMTRLDPTPKGWINAGIVSICGGAATLFCGILALRMLSRFTDEQNARFRAIETEA